MSLKYSFSHSFSHKTSLILVSLLFILASCLPSQTPTSQLRSSVTNTGDGTDTTNPVTSYYKEPNFPLPEIFIQEGVTRTSLNFSLPQNFIDSFLVRGLSLSTLLKKLPNTTKICIIAKYNQSGENHHLILSGKAKSFTDLVNKTTENYLLVEPANDVANQNDCLSQGITQAITSASTDTFNFSLNQICINANCSSSIQSSPIKFYFTNGEALPNITANSLKITVTGNSSVQTNSCASSDACRSRNFDCCLNSQCVMDGALKQPTPVSAEFESAKQDVINNPNRFTLYPQFYNVCPSRPEDPSPGSGPVSDKDPLYEASIRLLELKHLYDCLNLVDGEFSYCTQKIPNPTISTSSSKVPYYALKDDINFSLLNPDNFTDANKNQDNIVRVVYGGQVLVDTVKTATGNETSVKVADSVGNEAANTAPINEKLTSAKNDNLTDAQGITLLKLAPINAADTNLYITYKVDGTCTKLSTTLARCTKTYIQGYSGLKSTYYHLKDNETPPAGTAPKNQGKIFHLPSYAKFAAEDPILVKVDGITKTETDSWNRSTPDTTIPKYITFTSDILQNQKVEITYYSEIGANNVVESKSIAQTKVNEMCSCAGTMKCNVKPKFDDKQNIIDYECIYPVPESNDPPANQVVYISTKNAPHRYFDTNGLAYDEDISASPGQEGNEFKYNLNNLMKPNNADPDTSAYIGFNEIYGSFKTSGTYNSRPAKMVRVKKDQVYDIIVTDGNFTGCSSVVCGSDYYQNKLLFPQNFAGSGGGYIPNFLESSRLSSTSIYRSDDLLFGRACFVPATMIPWSHVGVTSEGVKEQRTKRLAAQHFLFANGYNRDWFGFDYGSVIGSFDGVKWFSIGNERRIKATSTKLFLAVNAYFTDLNTENNFVAAVSEMSPFSSAIPDHDSESDGAECQRAHYCASDRDCFALLGYDYTCQEVSSLNTEWPLFDAYANETVGTIRKTLSSIVGGYNGQIKRCVYRGRGAPCQSGIADTINGATTFNSSTSLGTLTCSSNHYCQPTTGSVFNNRIARFGGSVTKQNLILATPSDTHGLGARVLGRPYNYKGDKPLPEGATNLNGGASTNLVKAICVPGKDPNVTDVYSLNNNSGVIFDKMFGIGVTVNLTRVVGGDSMRSTLMSSCPAVNSEGKSVHLLGNVELNNIDLMKATITQNLSSRLLEITDNPLDGLFYDKNNYSNQVTFLGYSNNACLRAAGATCFSDLDCAPSSLIAAKVKTLSEFQNEPEKKFWEEELVCGNPEIKYSSVNEYNRNFDVRQNRCCRESGKVLTVYTRKKHDIWNWCKVDNDTNDSGETRVAGVSTYISDHRRYSRVHAAYDKMTCDRSNPTSSKPYALSVDSETQLVKYNQIKYQYNTLDTINSRTCCTTHWVRSFDDTNGGSDETKGREFNKDKGQKLNPEMFKHINWKGDIEDSTVEPSKDTNFTCSDDGFTHATQYCEIRDFTYETAKKYLDFASSLELLGIPQVPIKTKDEIFKEVNDSQGTLDPKAEGLEFVYSTAGKDPATSGTPGSTTPGYHGDFDFADSAGNKMYSAANLGQFDTQTSLKKIFKENEFNCCIPTGQEIPSSVTPKECCTGFIAYNDPDNVRCCLPDFADVTVYYNRYVSSEGRGLPESSYDPYTGYMKDPGMVYSKAIERSVCCSGEMTTGVALSRLPVPLGADKDKLLPRGTEGGDSMRFLYRTDGFDNASEYGNRMMMFEEGLKLNNHVYCVPQGYSM